jgi:hypothetical protein
LSSHRPNAPPPDLPPWPGEIGAAVLVGLDLLAMAAGSAAPVQDAKLMWSGAMHIAPDRNRTVETAFPLAGVIRSDTAGAYLVLADTTDKPIPDRVYAADRTERPHRARHRGTVAACAGNRCQGRGAARLGRAAAFHRTEARGTAHRVSASRGKA